MNKDNTKKELILINDVDGLKSALIKVKGADLIDKKYDKSLVNDKFKSMLENFFKVINKYETTDEEKIDAIYIQRWAIDYIDNPSDEMQDLAMSINHNVINLIKNQSLKSKLHYLSKNPDNYKAIENGEEIYNILVSLGRIKDGKLLKIS